MSLREYRRKRNFTKTDEPKIAGKKSKKKPIFVVQEHHASHLHYDFRLEAFGTLKSWAVPKGPPTEPGEKRLAVEVEDHPIPYAKFHGDIPEGNYGAGHVEIWDNGTWIPPENLKESLKNGHLEFELRGKKLKGRWLLQRTKSGGKKPNWLLIKRHDDVDKKMSTIENARKKIRSLKKKKDPSPLKISPQLAVLTDKVPHGPNWLYEIKFDGYRTLVFIDQKSVLLQTRGGLDWTQKYHPFEDEFKKIKVKSAILDGEMVALNEAGGSDFSNLQRALKTDNISELRFYAFDLLYLNGEDLRQQPLEQRKILLKELLKNSGSKALVYSQHWRTDGEELFKKCCQRGLEGIVAKKVKGSYHESRTPDWLKIKCSKRQELVIGGYTDPGGSRVGFGSVLMGAYDGKDFRYLGRVGTGFDDRLLKDMMKTLQKIETAKNPFTAGPSAQAKDVHFVKPVLVAEIEFKTWTADRVLRQASFNGLREDKKAKEVHMETVSKRRTKKADTEKTNLKDFRITHPDRLIYPHQKITKLDVAAYYKSVAPWLLRHTKDRPLSLLRCPDQSGQDCFFQKNTTGNSQLTDVYQIEAKDQMPSYINSESGLLQLVQWGVLEVHTWQSHKDKPLFADQIIFDLDPDPAVTWSQVKKAALQLKDLLERLGLKSFLKTTGGKGLHLHVPVAAVYSWDEIKVFARSVALELEARWPNQYTANLSKKVRKGKIFVDYLRNGFGATAIAPYSLRSKEAPYVAVPLDWSELHDLKGPHVFDIKKTLHRLAYQKADPWGNYSALKQKIAVLHSAKAAVKAVKRKKATHKKAALYEKY